MRLAVAVQNALFLMCNWTNPPDSKAEVTKEAVAAWLAHQEGLVRAAEAEFEVRRSPTRPEMIPLIRQVCRDRGDENEYLSYVYSEQKLAKDDILFRYSVRWWREGPKERFERFAPQQIMPRRTTVFDGQFVRTLARESEGLVGSVLTSDGAGWEMSNRIHPFSFLYEYAGQRYSTIVSETAQFSASELEREGKMVVRVSARHPKYANNSFVFFFDAEHRLIERQMFAKVPSDPAERLYQKHVFADYRPHEDPSGETIWFPYQAVYTYHVGNLRDGTPVECNTDTIIVKRIAFNTEIPEERFVLSFPEGTTVYDWSKGPETLETGKTPVAFPASGVSPLASRGNLSWWVLVAAVACIMLLLGAMVFRRRLASRKASP